MITGLPWFGMNGHYNLGGAYTSQSLATQASQLTALGVGSYRQDFYDSTDAATMASTVIPGLTGITVLPLMVLNPYNNGASGSEAAAYSYAYAQAAACAAQLKGLVPVVEIGNEFENNAIDSSVDGNDISEYDNTIFQVFRGALRGAFDGWRSVDTTGETKLAIQGGTWLHFGWLDGLLTGEQPDGTTGHPTVSPDIITWHWYYSMGSIINATGGSGTYNVLQELQTMGGGIPIMITEWGNDTLTNADQISAFIEEQIPIYGALAATYNLAGIYWYALYDLASDGGSFGLYESDGATAYPYLATTKTTIAETGVPGSTLYWIITATGAGSGAVPSSYVQSGSKVETIGGGAGGGNGIAGGGGGGGGYSTISNLALTPGATVHWSVGVGGAGGISSTTAKAGSNGGPTWFNGTTQAGSSCAANGGTGASTTAAGAGATTTGAIGTTKVTGGTGGLYGGGGGAGGPGGAGQNGGPANISDSGAGGGASGGGSAGGDDSGGPLGGNGGANAHSVGGGLGGQSSTATAGGQGQNGGGGGGGWGNGTTAAGGGGAGGIGTDMASGQAGAGGGGGSGAGYSGTPTGGGPGGAGGSFGGGGGGGGATGTTAAKIFAGGAGYQGVIVVSWTPVASTSGTWSSTLQNATASMTGSESESGTIAATLQNATASFTGSLGPMVNGTISSTLGNATASIAAGLNIPATINPSLQNAVASFQGPGAPVTAVISPHLANAVALISAGLTDPATWTSQLGNASANISGYAGTQGSVTAQLQNATAVINAGQMLSGTWTSHLANATCSMQAAPPYTNMQVLSR